jgi:hypothetical protein
MHWKWIAAAAAVATASAQSPRRPADRRVTVCLENAANAAFMPARPLASGIFAAIGVTVDWRGMRACPAGAIVIGITRRTPATFHPGALAYAELHGQPRIRIFYDRIASQHAESALPRVLAHVMAHEIAHILEGVNRHSASGVMKERWGPNDFAAMARKPLDFAPEDVYLIHHGVLVIAER